MKIKAKRIIPQVVECFNTKNKSVGWLNEYEFTDLRVQIAACKACGYYLEFEGKKTQILPSGQLSEWPVGLYDLLENQLSSLFKSVSPSEQKTIPCLKK